MSSDERHLNLIFVLMNTRRPLSREELRSKVGGYDPNSSEDSFQRMFERDKETLRLNSIPIETVAIDPGFNDAVGYRIDRDKFLLPDLRLDAEDRVILAVAAKAWKDAQLATLAVKAAEKMGESDDAAKSGISLGLTLSHEGASTLFSAIDDGFIVQFDYLTKGDFEAKTRTVEPWQVLLSGGHWYLVGYDHARQEQRTFKLARFKSEVAITSEPITNGKPDDFDIMGVVAYWRQSQDGDGLAVVHAQHNEAGTLRLQAETVEPGESHDVLAIRYTNEEILARDIAAVVDKVLSVEPQSLRAAVTRIVRGAGQRHAS